jgi:hypothetical protein
LLLADLNQYADAKHHPLAAEQLAFAWRTDPSF